MRIQPPRHESSPPIQSPALSRRWLPLAVGTALLVVGLAACGSSTPSAHSTEADPHALVAQGATLLDVRTVPEFEAGHLEGATSIPVDELGSRIREVPTDRPVVVYCRSGARSARAAAMLREAGYDVHDLGSIDNW